MPSDNDSLARGLGVLQALRAGGSESSIRETRQAGPVLLVWTAALHGLVFSVAAAASIGGVIATVWAADRGLWALVLFGPCLAVGMGLLALNQFRELTDTFWRRSPFERAMEGPLSRLLESMARPAVGAQPAVPPIVPYRVNGDTHATGAGPVGGVPIQGEDAVLLDILELAQREGLEPTRRGLHAEDGASHWQLRQSGVLLTREVYEQALESLVRWGFVTRPAPRIPTRWLIPPGRAYRILLHEVERRGNLGG